MVKILTWISGSTYSATGSQVVHTGLVMIVLLAIVLCRRWMTILPLGGEAARAVGMALTPARGSAAVGSTSDGNSHHDHWSIEFRGINGAAYRQNDGVSQDNAAYCDVCSHW
jgi:hypothetical protein